MFHFVPWPWSETKGNIVATRVTWARILIDFTDSAVTKIVRTVFCRWADSVEIRILERGTAEFGPTNRNSRIGTREQYFRFCTAQISNVDRLSSTSCSTQIILW